MKQSIIVHIHLFIAVITLWPPPVNCIASSNQCVCVCVTPEVASQNLEDAQSGTTNMYTCILISAAISIRF